MFDLFQKRLYQRVFFALALALSVVSASPNVAPVSANIAARQNFADWHLPLPAGEWMISRGPCGSGSLFNHECSYYENQCAVDFVPLAGSMENVPVLAPQAGRAFFMGTRSETGLMLLLLHDDGRVSGYMHLSKIVIGPDERVTPGQVVAYAGSSGKVRAHLHFFIQPNAVERRCELPSGLDELDYRNGLAVSRNRPWSALTLTDPPATVPDWLPTLSAWPANGVAAPERVALSPGAAVSLPVAVKGRFGATDTLTFGSAALSPARRAPEYALFNLPLIAPARPGNYELTLQGRVAGRALSSTLRYTTRAVSGTIDVDGILLANPLLVSPSGWSSQASTPRLCWTINLGRERKAQQLAWRAIVIGPTTADSGWLDQTCWTPPTLASGRYLWKVFVRDEQGRMNRTNQRPWAFVIR